jgi:hypothetical protein
MDPVRLEVTIDCGRILPCDPEKLPANGTGVLTITSSCGTSSQEPGAKRVRLPLIRGDGQRIINPTSDQLDASLWGE